MVREPGAEDPRTPSGSPVVGAWTEPAPRRQQPHVEIPGCWHTHMGGRAGATQQAEGCTCSWGRPVLLATCESSGWRRSRLGISRRKGKPLACLWPSGPRVMPLPLQAGTARPLRTVGESSLDPARDMSSACTATWQACRVWAHTPAGHRTQKKGPRPLLPLGQGDAVLAACPEPTVCLRPSGPHAGPHTLTLCPESP